MESVDDLPEHEGTPVEPVAPAVENIASDAGQVPEVTQDESAPTPEPPAPEEPPVDRNKKNLNVNLDREVIEDPKPSKISGYFPISLITRPLNEFEVVNNTSEKVIEDLQKTVAGRDWLYNFSRGANHYQAGGIFVNSFTREGSDWGQFVDYNGQRLAAGSPGIGGHGQKLSGAKAVAAMRAGMGTATAITAPLWHSGVWMTITAPMDSELLVLMHQIMDEKIELGNATMGLAFSSNGVFTARKLVEFILPRVYASTMIPMAIEDQMKVIKVTDYQSLLHMLGLSVYPHGFNYRKPCISDVTACEAVTENHLHLSRIMLVDRSSLSVEQRRFMSDRKKVHDVDAVVNFQKMGRSGLERTVELSENISVTFRVPSLFDWFENGSRWVRSVEETVEAAFGNSMSVKQKNTYLAEQAVLTFLRQYAHWIGMLKDRDMEYNDAETIDAMIGALSENEEVMNNFMTELNKFIDDVTYATTAIPAHDCPACGAPQSIAGNPNPEVIPLDMQQILFSLADQRTLRAKINTTNS